MGILPMIGFVLHARAKIGFVSHDTPRKLGLFVQHPRHTSPWPRPIRRRRELGLFVQPALGKSGGPRDSSSVSNPQSAIRNSKSAIETPPRCPASGNWLCFAWPPNPPKRPQPLVTTAVSLILPHPEIGFVSHDGPRQIGFVCTTAHRQLALFRTIWRSRGLGGPVIGFVCTTAY